jgi:copper(I)-binding protein
MTGTNMKTLSLPEASIAAALFTALSYSTLLMAQENMKMMDHGNMDHSAKKVGDMKNATPAKTGYLVLSGAWARQSFGKAVNSAGFLTIKNTGASDDMLIGVSSKISKRTELHTHIKDGDVMRMRRVKGGIKVPKNGHAELKSGGFHLMFIGLKAPLKSGTTFPVTLKFKNAGDITLNMNVQKMAMPRGSN